MALLHTNRRNKEVVNSAEVSADSPDKLVQKKYYIQDGWCMGQPILEIKYGQIKMWSEPGDEIVIPTHLLFKIVVEYATNLLNEQKSCISEIQQ